MPAFDSDIDTGLPAVPEFDQRQYAPIWADSLRMRNAIFLLQQILTSVSGGMLPVGGTAGQALVKNSGIDFDALWTTLAHNTSLSAYQGGTATERYHLDATQHTALTAFAANINEAIDDRVSALLVAGANIILTYNDVANTLTITGTGGGGGAGATWTELEVDFGSEPVYEASFTITDATILSSASKVIVVPCGKAATGRTADDWQWDTASFAANPGTGSATCYAVFSPGPIVGKRMIQYTVG